MQAQKKKIALVYDAIFPYVTGGGEKRFFEVGKRLAEEGYDVHLYGMKSWTGPDTISESGLTLHGIMDKEPLYTTKGRRSIGEALRFGLATFRLHKESFDVIDCCGFPYFSLFPLRVITWAKRKPLYCTWHEVWGCKYWQQYLGPIGILGCAVEYIAARLPDTIISVSDSTTQALRTELGRKGKIITIPNGIDFEKIDLVEAAEEESDIIFVGRLTPHKNVDKLIEALVIVRQRLPDVMLTIIGEGPQGVALRNLAKDLDLEKNIHFSGFAQENKLFSYMKSSKMLALPSSREGFGMVVLEAKACGLPVLTVDEPHNAARHLVKDGKGDKVTEVNPASIAQGILELLENRTDSTQKQGIERYDWRIITAEVEDAFALSNNIK